MCVNKGGGKERILDGVRCLTEPPGHPQNIRNFGRRKETCLGNTVGFIQIAVLSDDSLFS